MMTSSASQAGEQRYRNLFEHMPICIFVVDLTARPATLVAANRRAELVYGYTAAELMGMPVAQLAPADTKPTIQSIVQRGRPAKRRRLRPSASIGTRFPVRVIAAPDPTDDDHMIVTVEDITAEKQRRSEAEAIDAERRRIAHEIHDGVAHRLAGLRFKSALWSHLADAAPPGMRTALDELQVVLIAAIVDLRRSIFALRPVDLNALGFFPALAQLVDDFGDQNHLVPQLDVAGTEDNLPSAYQLPLFRIIQEGLNNIGQHARASSVLVRLAVDVGGSVAATVRDDGRGFDPQQLTPVDRDGHFGLRQMRERILDLCGALDIHSAPGQGTELVITLPPVAQEATHAAN